MAIYHIAGRNRCMGVNRSSPRQPAENECLPTTAVCLSVPSHQRGEAPKTQTHMFEFNTWLPLTFFNKSGGAKMPRGKLRQRKTSVETYAELYKLPTAPLRQLCSSVSACGATTRRLTYAGVLCSRPAGELASKYTTHLKICLLSSPRTTA